MLSSALPVLLALALVPAQGPSRVRTTLRTKSAPKAEAEARPRGTITDRTRERVYFDRGAKDGFVEGAVVEGTRRGRSLGRCTVDHASDHRASCKDEGAFLVDDGVRLVDEPAAAAEEAEKPLVAHPGQTPVEVVPESITNTAFTKVAFERKAPSDHLSPRGSRLRRRWRTWCGRARCRTTPPTSERTWTSPCGRRCSQAFAGTST